MASRSPGEPDEGGESRHVAGCAAAVGNLGDEGTSGRPTADLGGRDGVSVGQGVPSGAEVAGLEVGAGGVDEMGGSMLGG